MYTPYYINGKELKFDAPQVMGIINLTPDSFFDGGKYDNIGSILKDVEKKIKEGASIIDIGAASSKPSAIKLTPQEEIKRLSAPLQLIRKEFPDVFISVDTYLSEVAEIAIHEGADIINDISAGELDANMLPLIAKNQVIYVAMHMQGTPQTMQEKPTYQNVEKELFHFFNKKLVQCNELGIEKLILDVGFGFGKTLEHNYQLLKHLPEFKALKKPLLVGLSRKSMIYNLLKNTASEALNGTSILNILALQNGASILRVHDVKEAKEAIELFQYYKKIQ